MRYEIKGGAFPIVVCNLENGEKMITERGSMVWMSPNMQMETRGGGLLADMAKHSHLDEAQGAIERLQSQLRRFKTELADVTIHADMQVNVDGFLRFADYFFDGLFADWAVMDKISQSQSQVQSTKNQIDSVLSRLNSMMSAAEREQAQTKSKLDALVLEA